MSDSGFSFKGIRQFIEKLHFSRKRLYISFSRVYPSGFRLDLEQLLVYGGFEAHPALFLGPTMILGFLVLFIGLLMPFTLYSEFDPLFALYAFLGFFTVQLLSYMVIYFRAEDRSARVEKILPDAIQLIASNIKAGMTPFAAIRLAARPDFGPLETELKRATVHALGERSFAVSLMSITERIKSESLRRAMGLFTTSMKSGGHLADLLEETAKDISESQSLKNEMVANTKTYLLFIMFTVALGAPVLLAISIHFVSMSDSLKSKMGSSELVGELGMGGGENSITVEFLTNASYIIIFITTGLASAMIGVITEGKEKYGAKYMPILTTIALVLFYFARIGVSSFIGGTF